MSVHDDAISAHGGGELVDLKAPAAERASLAAHAAKLASVTLNARDIADLEMLATGAFSPLTGFMGEADYTRARDEMRLASGVPWSIPITLGVDEATAKSLKTGTEIALATEDGKRLAILKLAEIYKVDRKLEAQNVFGTSEEAHPGAKNVTAMPPYCLAGKVTLIEEIPGRTFLEFPREPRQTRAAFRERGWKKIVAFQTRNPTHRAHEYIQKAALEICDGLMIHPLVGETKGDDVPAAVRMETYKVLLERVLPEGPRDDRRVPGAHALRRPARGYSACDRAAQLRMHAFHRGTRSRGRRQLLRQLRRAENLRALQAGGTRNHAADVREHLLLQALQLDGVVQDLPAFGRGPRDPVGHESPRDAARGRSAAAGIHAPGARSDPGESHARREVVGIEK